MLEKLKSLRANDVRVSRLLRAVAHYSLTIRSWNQRRDGLRLVLARRGSGSRGARRLRNHRVVFLPEPLSTAQVDRLSHIPGEGVGP